MVSSIDNLKLKTRSRSRRTILQAIAAGAITSFYPKPVRALNKSDVVVIGAGLSGLYAATILQDEGYKVTVLEADNRVGGTSTVRTLVFPETLNRVVPVLDQVMLDLSTPRVALTLS